jgi:tRNA A-37 threonylcarbamoyl transferase component Bud32
MLTKDELIEISNEIRYNNLEIIDPWNNEKGHINNCLRIYKYKNQYAIKCAHTKLDQNLIHCKTIENGYYMTKDLKYDGIIKNHGFYSNDNVTFCVYDYIPTTLKNVLHKLDHQEKNRILSDARNIIFYLWKNQISHYDLTTKNILLKNNIYPVLIDFQIAKRTVQNSIFELCTDMCQQKNLMIPNCCGTCRAKSYQDLKEEIWKKN